MKATKRNKFTTAFCLVVLCVVIGVLAISAKFNFAYAEVSSNTQNLIEICKSYTEDVQHNGINLLDYKDYVDRRFQPDISVEDTTLWDEQIMTFVPERLFQDKKEEFTYIGEKYGFYFDYDLSSDSYFIFLIRNDWDPNISGHLSRKISPIYYERYRYDSNTGKAALIYREETPGEVGLIYVRHNYYERYSDVKKLFMKDVTFTGHLYNENHPNIDEAGYDKHKDNGGYFIGGSYQFNGVTKQEGKFDFAAEIFKIGVGYIPKYGDLIGLALDVADVISAAQNFAVEASKDFRDEVTNIDNHDFTMYHVLSEAQIMNYGNLLKDFVDELKTPNNAHGLLLKDNTHYANATFYYDFANDKSPWDTIFKGKIKLDIVEEYDVNGIETEIRPYKTIESLESQYQISSGEKITVTEGEHALYAFPLKEQKLNFTAPQNGEYTFETFGSVKNEFKTNKGDITKKDDMLNEVLKVSLKEGEIFEFSTKNMSDSIGRYQIRVSFTPQIILWGDNNVDLKYDKTFIRFTSPKNLNYRFTLDNNADVLHLLNSNFEVVQTSAAGELLAILNANETYYLRIDRSGSETKTVNLTVNDEMYVFFENIEGITSEIPEKITISSTGSVSLPTTEKRGYTFEGWWTNLDAYGENVTNDNIFDYLRPELHLSAKWTPIHYTIFYEENGGDTIPDGDYIIEHVVTLNQNITKAGFVFCGWYDNPALGGAEIKTFPAGNIGNKTFYAKWVKEKFTISFDVNSNYTDGLSATIEESKQVVDFNQNYVLPVPILDGFIFQGWYFDTVKFTDKNGNSLLAYTNEGNITLTAKWTREKYYIKINANGTFRWLTKDGNDFTFSADKTFVEYEIGLCPNCFVESQIQKGGTLGRQIKDYLYREGHLYLNLIKDPNDSSSLACWKNSELGTEFQNNDTIEIFADYRIESQFKIYISEKEDAGYTNIIYADYDESINYPMPSKAGYTFDYFIVSPDEEKNDVYKNTQFNPGTKFNYKNMPDLSIGVEHDGDAIYLSPVFKANEYNISFTIDGEVWNRKTVTFGESYNSSNGNAFPIPTKTGYKFIGWFSESGIKITDANGNVNCWDIASNCLLKPNWEQNQYKVTFNKQGGSGGTDYVIATYNSEMPYAEKPTLLGHTFMGYFLEIDGQEIQYYTSNMESAHLWDIARDETLKAKWEANQYKITIDYNDGSGRTKDIDVIFGKEIELLPYAPERLGFSFDGAYASPNGVGKKYFYSNDIVYDNDRNDYFENFVSFIEVWDEPASRTIYANWVPYSMDIYPEFYCHGDWSSQKEYRITTNEILKLTPLDRAGYTFKSWLIIEYDPDNNWNLGQNTTISYNNEISYTMQVFLDYGKLASRYQFVAEYTKNPVEEDTCVAEGTLITLSDGTQKAVEDLTGSEQLLVWNLFTGTFDTAPILFIDHDPAREYEVINLAFSDETTVKVISEHGFWDFDLNEYVFLRRDAAKYIGHWFNKQTTDAEGKLGWTKVQLVNVTIQKEVTTAWSPVTYGHLCYYVNGMLSMPGATEGLINIFDVDPNTLKIDEAKYNADIAEYGLYTYEEFAETYPVPEVIFEAFGGKYLKVSIGKGLIDSETLGRLIERYAKFFA